MQEIVKISWCDGCLKRDGVKVAAQRSERLTIGGMQADIDLCEACDTDLLARPRELMRAIGSRAERLDESGEDADGDGATKTQCPLCPVWIDARSRVGHVRNRHSHLKASQIDWRYDEKYEKAWLCKCGLTFTKPRSRDMHARRRDTEKCAIPSPDVPVPPKRPI